MISLSGKFFAKKKNKNNKSRKSLKDIRSRVKFLFMK